MIYGEIQLLRCTIIGSTLAYALLVSILHSPGPFPYYLLILMESSQVLGGSFLYASYGKPDIKFNKVETSIMSTLVMAASICLVSPTMIHFASRGRVSQDSEGRRDIYVLSHGAAIVLLLVFASYIMFRFKSHRQIFSRRSSPLATPTTTIPTTEEQLGPNARALALSTILLGGIVCTVVCANYLFCNVRATIQRLDLPKPFVGLVILPLTGNMAKSAVIINTSRTRILDLAMRTIMTSVLDNLLFVMPTLVLLGWTINKPVELEFGILEAVVFLLAMIIMACIVQNGKATYFEGFMLIGT